MRSCHVPQSISRRFSSRYICFYSLAPLSTIGPCASPSLGRADTVQLLWQSRPAEHHVTASGRVHRPSRQVSPPPLPYFRRFTFQCVYFVRKRPARHSPVVRNKACAQYWSKISFKLFSLSERHRPTSCIKSRASRSSSHSWSSPSPTPPSSSSPRS
ncbi:hypothetical protein OH77DRAFT_1069785 [Trametes cingulata]|nr:hypothetical protein OH77DRAFT_1069785 [Trametes cingulata]